MTDAAAIRTAALRAKDFFEKIAPGDVARIDAIYASGAYFRDPFNEVAGIAAIARVYARMFEHLDDVRTAIVARWAGKARSMSVAVIRSAPVALDPGILPQSRRPRIAGRSSVVGGCRQ